MANTNAEDPRKERPHICPVCGEYTFYDWFSYDECPVCGLEDGYYSGNIDDVDEVLPPNWVSITEARWIWKKFHTNVNEYALDHKKEALDKLDMSE